MTPQHAEALMFAGITPPTSGTKTTCPHCSHERSKPGERCLKVFPHPGRVDWICFHCHFDGSEVVQ